MSFFLQNGRYSCPKTFKIFTFGLIFSEKNDTVKTCVPKFFPPKMCVLITYIKRTVAWILSSYQQNWTETERCLWQVLSEILSFVKRLFRTRHYPQPMATQVWLIPRPDWPNQKWYVADAILIFCRLEIPLFANLHRTMQLSPQQNNFNHSNFLYL